MSSTTLRIVFQSDDWHVESSAEIEEPLDEMLLAAGVGEIVSGGVAPSGVFFDVELEDPATGLPFLRAALRRMNVPHSTSIEGLGGSVGVYES